MQPAVPYAVKLLPHPESRNGVVRNVGARISRPSGGTLAITYSIEGDLARLKLPPPRAPRFAHGLWQHTCCECFIALDHNPGYHEFNFAPSGEWAAYAFTSYREGSPHQDEVLYPQITVRRGDDGFELKASIPLGRLSPVHPRAKLLLALSVVIEGNDGVLSYWALKHPAGKPDFHHRDSFALELEAA